VIIRDGTANHNIKRPDPQQLQPGGPGAAARQNLENTDFPRLVPVTAIVCMRIEQSNDLRSTRRIRDDANGLQSKDAKICATLEPFSL
jgi:hypothetical protein